jgi:lipid A 4'-phosphatase
MTENLGGDKEFLPILSRGENIKSDCNSFPSGHAAVGFYLMTPAFFLYRRHHRWAAAFLFFGVAGGAIMGIARMAAGGHFVSDIIWAGAIVYFTALILAAFFRFLPEKT